MAKSTYTPASEDRFVDKKRTNVKTDLIEITEDKLKVILMENLQNLTLRNSWLTPFSLLVTCLLAAFTSDFKSIGDIDPNFWKYLFIFGSLASAIWLTIKLIEIYNKSGKCSIGHLLKTIKNVSAESSESTIHEVTINYTPGPPGSRGMDSILDKEDSWNPMRDQAGFQGTAQRAQSIWEKRGLK